MSEVNVVSQKNWRHTHHELWRYFQATQRASSTETNFSVCGPDQTKVGTEMALNLSMVLMQTSGLAAVMPPQVIPLVEMNKYKIITNC